MYRLTSTVREPAEEFKLPFSGQLSGDNRWVKLSEFIPWDEFETEYAQQFSAEIGAPAKPFRMAFGSLVIKERLGLSDEETVEQITENPYLQYFLGLGEYSTQAPFDPSMMVHFRKRISPELANRINEQIVLNALKNNESKAELKEGQGSAPEALEESEVVGNDSPGQKGKPSVQQSDRVGNAGHLIMDATCAPADIHYPTDLNLLNKARLHTERVIDQLYGQIREPGSEKPRTYRHQARKDFLNLSKKRRPKAKQRRKGIRKQLNYIERNLKHIDALLEAGASLERLSHRDYRQLLVVAEVYRQQRQMYKERSQRIDNRIVSFSQPHVRPIVRGKAGHPVEFGAKLSASCTQGFVFVDRMSWDNFNESGDLQQQAENYKRRFGSYPAVIYADRIYGTRANRKWCKERNIRLMGPPLGRPAQAQKASLAQQTREDERIRTEIEGKFGQGKRRFSLSRIMAKLASTAETSITICFIVMNLERLLQQGRSLFLSIFTWFLAQFLPCSQRPVCSFSLWDDLKLSLAI